MLDFYRALCITVIITGVSIINFRQNVRAIVSLTIELVCCIFLVLCQIAKSWVRFFYAPKKSLLNEVVLLTGAAGGLGWRLAKKLVEKGCKIILLDVDEDGLENLCGDLNCQKKKNAHYFVCDITNAEEIASVKQRCVDSGFPPPTILINNAGVVAGKPFQKLQPCDVRRSFNVNVLSHYALINTFLPGMLKANHGNIVSVASILGVDSVAGVADYSASKAAAVSLMQSLRQELRASGHNKIHCTTILPYMMSTQMFYGATPRFLDSHILGLLSPHYVADRIISAIQSNQTTVYVPRVLYFVMFVRSFLPDAAYDIICDFLQANTAMQNFKGREEKK